MRFFGVSRFWDSKGNIKNVFMLYFPKKLKITSHCVEFYEHWKL